MSDFTCPLGISEQMKTLSNRFVEAAGRDLDCVLDAV
jgi:hypothetical protein